jgi:hypothetical protein
MAATHAAAEVDLRRHPLPGAVALVRHAMAYARQGLCAMRGHDMALHREPGRLSLQCLACGAQSPGWTIDVNPALRIPPSRGARRQQAPADGGRGTYSPGGSLSRIRSTASSIRSSSQS